MINLKNINKSCVTAVIMAMCLMTAGCSSQAGTANNNENTNNTTVTSSITAQAANVTHADDADDYKTDITEEFQITTNDTSAITQSGSVYTITKAGEYTVSGLLTDGQLIIDAADDAEITLILNQTAITCLNGSPIYVKNASNVKIKAEENTYNSIIDARTEVTDNSSSDENGNAAIYSTCNLKLVGKGALSVTGGYNNGIQTKDDLSIKNVTLKVTAVNNAIKGNDSVDIESGEIIAISKKGDGIKTSNSSLSNKGNQKGIVTITGGNIDIYAACDGIDAAYGVDISGNGNVNIYTDTYSEYSEEVTDTSSSSNSSGINSSNNNSSGNNSSNNSSSNNNSSGNNSSGNNSSGNSKSSANASMMSYTTTANNNQGSNNQGSNNQGNNNMNTPPDMNNNSGFGNSSQGRPGMPDNNMNSTGNSSKKSYSTKGIKADSEITISGAVINISSTDDGIHANSDSDVLETGEAGKGTVAVSDGTITIASGDDGIHADKELNISGGYINVTTSYEGLEAMSLNISDGKVYVYATDDGLNACTGDGTTAPLINISGGYVDVTTASGDTDGIDSNGSYTQSGGMVLVKGGSSSGQVSGSIDVDGTITITGGTCIALGGVCETPVNSSNAYVFSSVSFNAGSYSVKDSDGNEVTSFTLNESYSNGWICSTGLVTGKEYTLYYNQSSVTNWTQTSGTMVATGSGGFGGNQGNRGGFGNAPDGNMENGSGNNPDSNQGGFGNVPGGNMENGSGGNPGGNQGSNGFGGNPGGFGKGPDGNMNSGNTVN